MVSNQWFRITQEQSAHLLYLTLPDTLDSMDIDRLIEDLLQNLTGRANERWVIDLTEVKYMGSSVLGLMVNIRQRVIQAKGRIVLCGMSVELAKIFKTCCLERLFTIVKTRPEAIALATGK